MSNETMVQRRSELAEAITQAVASVTGLEPHQITAVDANANDIFIDYVGPTPGMGGASGRRARMTFDTKTGRRTEDVTL